MGRRGTPPSDSFTTADAYAFERELEKLHLDNSHVRDKIRQQLPAVAPILVSLRRGKSLWRGKPSVARPRFFNSCQPW